MSTKRDFPFWSINIHPEEFIKMKYNNCWVNPIASSVYLEDINTNMNTKFRLEKSLVKKILEIVVDLGARCVRTDFAWNFLKMRDGWNNSAFDCFTEYLALLKEYNLEIICILYRPPTWLWKKDRVAYLTEFKEYAYEISKRYGDRIAYYQLWNEPNNFINDKLCMITPRFQFYCDLIYHGYLGIQTNDSVSQAHACAINIMTNNDIIWEGNLEQYFVWLNEHAHTIGVIGIDHYPGTWSNPLIRPWEDWYPLDAAISKANGKGSCAGKDIAIMETGYASGGSNHHEKGQEEWINLSLNVAYKKAFECNSDPNKVNKVILFNWYELLDGDVNPIDVFGFEHNFGILAHDPSFNTIRRKQGYDSLKRTIGFNTQNISAIFSTKTRGREFFCRTTQGKLANYVLDENGQISKPIYGFPQAGIGKGDISCVFNESNKLVGLFAKGSDGHLHYYYSDQKHGWNWGGEWFFYTQVYGTIAAVYNVKKEHPEVFFKGSDGYLHFGYLNNGAWAHDNTSFIDKGGKVLGSIAAFYNYNENHKHPEVFFKGENGFLHYCYVENGTWQWGGEWFYQVGEVLGDIAAIYNPTQRNPEVFFKGGKDEDGKLRHFYIDKAQWTLDSQFPNEKPLGEISAIYNPSSSHSDIFFMGSNGHLRHIYFETGKWMVDEKSFIEAPLIEGGISALWIEGQRGELGIIEVIYRSRGNKAVHFYKEQNKWNFKEFEID